jgi:hypothetical protein
MGISVRLLISSNTIPLSKNRTPPPVANRKEGGYVKARTPKKSASPKKKTRPKAQGARLIPPRVPDEVLQHFTYKGSPEEAQYIVRYF